MLVPMRSRGAGRAPEGTERYDVVVVGGGHNGLVAAAYLAQAGRSVLVLERLDHVGGAAVSEQPFAGIDARLSRYAYLVSLLPDQIIADLGLGLELRSRPVSSYTPVRRDGKHTGLLVEREEGPVTAASFRELTGDDREYDAWRRFHAELGSWAAQLAATLLRPLPHAKEVRYAAGPLWDELVEQPLGDCIEQRFADDAVRGVVLTDGQIGTFADAHDPLLRSNRCLLYHLIGNGTGEWRVPVGGMGAVTASLAAAARRAGAEIRTNAQVTRILTDSENAEVAYRFDDAEHWAAAPWVLSGVAPVVLGELLGRGVPERCPEGAQLKLNLLVERLPRLRSGVDPRVAFAGTFHVAEEYSNLQRAYATADDGLVPEVVPGELYCHTLTDSSILPPDLAARGWHTLTYFGLHTPARLFAEDDGAAKETAVRRALAALDEHLVEPVADCLATDAKGRLCVEVKTPQDIEHALTMPGGHIFHGDLSWPWLTGDTPAESPAEAWGVATEVDNVLLCGSGAVRGGAVSGIGGHNAAMAVLASHA